MAQEVDAKILIGNIGDATMDAGSSAKLIKDNIEKAFSTSPALIKIDIDKKSLEDIKKTVEQLGTSLTVNIKGGAKSGAGDAGTTTSMKNFSTDKAVVSTKAMSQATALLTAARIKHSAALHAEQLAQAKDTTAHKRKMAESKERIALIKETVAAIKLRRAEMQAEAQEEAAYAKEERAIHTSNLAHANFQQYLQSVNPKALVEFKDDIEEINNLLGQGTPDSLEMANNKLKDFKANMKRAGYEGGNIFTFMHNKIKTFAAYLMSSAFTMLAVNGFRSLIDNVHTLDDALTDLRIVTGNTRAETEELLVTYSKLAQQLGSTTSDVAAGAVDWLRQGYNEADSVELLTQSTILSLVGDMESAEATDALTAAIKGYQLAVGEASDVVDKFFTVDMAAATSAEDLALALAKTAANAKLAGLNLDDVIGQLAVVNETMKEDGESTGTFYNTMLSRMGRIKAGELSDPESGDVLSDVEATLKGLGIELRSSNAEFRNFGEVLDEVGSKWDEFSSVQQRAIATAFAGTRQQTRFITLMAGWETAGEYATIAANSAGTAAEKLAIYQESITAKQQAMTAAFEAFSMNILDGQLIGGLYEIGTAVANLGAAAPPVAIELAALSALIFVLVSAFGALKVSTFGLSIGRTATSIINFFKGISTASLAAASSVTILKVATVGLIAAIPLLLSLAHQTVQTTADLKDALTDVQDQLVALNGELETNRERMEALQNLKTPSIVNKEELILLGQENKYLEARIALLKEEERIAANAYNQRIKQELALQLAQNSGVDGATKTSTGTYRTDKNGGTATYQYDTPMSRGEYYEQAIEDYKALIELGTTYGRMTDEERANYDAQKAALEAMIRVTATAYSDAAAAIDANGDGASELIAAYNALAALGTDAIGLTNTALAEMADTTGDVVGEMQTLAEWFESLSDTSTHAGASVSALADAYADLAENNELTVGAMITLLDQFPELIQYYDTETNTLNITKTLLEQKFELEKQTYKNAIKLKREDTLAAIENAQATYAELTMKLALAKQFALEGDIFGQGHYTDDVRNFIPSDLAAELKAAKSMLDTLTESLARYDAELGIIDSITLGDLNTSSSGSSATDAVEEYVAELDKLYKLKQDLANVQQDYNILQARSDLLDENDIERRSKYVAKMVASLHEQNDLLHDQNELRREMIATSADELRALGFDVQFDPENNELFIANMEHINDLVATSAGEYETLEDATNALRQETEALISSMHEWNDENRTNSVQWYENLKTINDLMESIRSSMQDYLDEQHDQLTELLELTKDMIRQQKEDEIDALEEQIDAYAKIIDARKELLDLAERERAYTEEVSEATKTLSELQSRAAALQLAADSGDRQAALELGSVRDEIAEKQKELNNIQHDHYLEVTEDALDSELEAFEDVQNIKIQEIEDFLDDNERLNQVALARLDNMNEQLFNDLLGYALRYTDTTRNELVSMWETAAQAASKYGSITKSIEATSSTVTIADAKAETAKSLVAQMRQNANNWHTYSKAGNKAQAQALADQNVAIAEQLSVLLGTPVTKDANGVWRINGEKLFEKYHTGGAVGGVTTTAQNEMLALLETKEFVLTESNQTDILNRFKAYESLIGAFVPAIGSAMRFNDVATRASSTVCVEVNAPISMTGDLTAETLRVLQQHSRTVANLVASQFK